MKNYTKQLFSTLSLISLLGSSPLTALPAISKPQTIDVYNIQAQKPNDLIALHKQATETYLKAQANQPEVTENNLQDLNFQATQNSKPTTGLTLQPQADGKFVTPAAFLTSVLQNAKNYQDAFDRLSPEKNAKRPRSQQNLIQQSRTLLVRAHPELVPGLTQKLAYLPNRFMSYVKEKMPTFSTAAGKQRFTQSVVMETLKDMPELDSKEFADKLDEITEKYANDLTSISNLKTTDPSFAQMSMQWSRNLVSDIALVAYRTPAIATGAAIGAARGAGLGAIKAVGQSAIAGINTGMAVNQYFMAQPSDNQLLNRALAGEYITADSYQPVSNVGSVTAGVTTGITLASLSTAVMTPIMATKGAIKGAIEGAKYGDNFARSTSRVAYNQGTQLFQPKSTLVEPNDLSSFSFDDASSDSASV